MTKKMLKFSIGGFIASGVIGPFIPGLGIMLFCSSAAIAIGVAISDWRK